MSDIVIGVIVRPLTAIILLGSGILIAHLIKPLIPEGRLKRILYKHVTR